MSIVNDALKKAEKEFEFKIQDKQVSNVNPVHKTPSKPGKKQSVVIPAVFIIAGFIVVWVFMSHKNSFEPVSSEISGNPDNNSYAIQSTLNSIEQEIPAEPTPIIPQNMAKLNGIVYGEEGKWAIVDDKIVKEGDDLLDGKIVSITRDFVKIEKKDGSELILSLK